MFSVICNLQSTFLASLVGPDNPGRLEGYNLSLADVILSLKNKNLDIPGGVLGSGRKEFLVRTMGEAETLQQIERVILRSNSEGGHVYLRDVARVTDTFEEATTLGRLDGEKTISLMVMKSKTGNTVKIVEAVREQSSSNLVHSVVCSPGAYTLITLNSPLALPGSVT